MKDKNFQLNEPRAAKGGSKIPKAMDYLIEACGDGTRHTDLINGNMNDVKKSLAALMFFGTYEQALVDPMVGTYLRLLDDPDEWHLGVWEQDGEQCNFRVCEVYK